MTEGVRRMDAVRVEYHREPEGWWADSPDVQGFVATGFDLHEVRLLVREGLPFYLEQESVEVYEIVSGTDAPLVDMQAKWSMSEVSVQVTSASCAWTEKLASHTPWLGVGSWAGAPSGSTVTPV